MAKINTTNYQPVTAWNGTQDLFVVEQPDGTKVATPEQVKQYVLNDMDEVPTEDSDNPVKSGGVFSTMAVLDNAVSALNTNRAYSVNLGSITATSANDALGKAWDALTIYDKPVLVRYNHYGVWMGLMFKYGGDHMYGMAMTMKYDGTSIYTMNVNNGIKYYATK